MEQIQILQAVNNLCVRVLNPSLSSATSGLETLERIDVTLDFRNKKTQFHYFFHFQKKKNLSKLKG